MNRLSRRDFLRQGGTATAAAWSTCSSWPTCQGVEAVSAAEPIIDIHQHTNYRERTTEQLIAHQRTMGVTHSILLPAGSAVKRPSTGEGIHNGLGGVGAGGNETALVMSRQYPQEFSFGANDVTDLPGGRAEISNFLDLGAIIIGEQKFQLECDSWESQSLYELAADYGVPILMHWNLQSGLRAIRDDAEKIPADHVYRSCANLVGQHRPESSRSENSLSAGTCHAGRSDRSILG